MYRQQIATRPIAEALSLIIGVAFACQAIAPSVLAAPTVPASAPASAAAASTTAGAPKALVAQGKKELAAGRLDKAIDLLSKAAKALGTAPGSCECHFCLGHALCEKARTQKAAHNADAQKNYLAARRELRTAIRVGRGNDISKKANAYMVANLPPSLMRPRTGDGTEMIAARLGLHGQDRGAGGVARAQIFEFYAPWCKPCNDLKPVLAKLKRQYGDQVEIKSFNVDDDAAQDVIDQYEVSPIPTIIYLTPDSKVVGYTIGYSGEGNVTKQLHKILTTTNSATAPNALPAPSSDNNSSTGSAPASATPKG